MQWETYSSCGYLSAPITLKIIVFDQRYLLIIVAVSLPINLVLQEV